MAGVHHVQLCCRRAAPVVRFFTAGLGFGVVGGRVTSKCRQWLLRSGQSVFVVTEKQHKHFRPHPPDVASEGSFLCGEPWTQFCCDGAHRRDCVFNIALQVRDVAACTDRACEAGGRVVQSPVQVSDAAGSVRYSIVAPPVADSVTHTLLDTSHYGGHFLPGFASAAPRPVAQADGSRDGWPQWQSPTQFVDHVALACAHGQSGLLERWYAHVLGMRRFRLNAADTPADGTVFGGDVQMALKAMHYWLCAETGMVVPSSVDSQQQPFKLVFAESLHPDSHVASFLSAHGSAGFQHIGLHAHDIVSCVRQMSERGVQFRMPPPGYYGKAGKGDEMTWLGLSRDEQRSFRQLGLLVDAEADERRTARDRYLVQIFTRPIFAEPTFFLEVLQRHGARGFGQGNIDALARSIIEEQLSVDSSAT